MGKISLKLKLRIVDTLNLVQGEDVTDYTFCNKGIVVRKMDEDKAIICNLQSKQKKEYFIDSLRIVQKFAMLEEVSIPPIEFLKHPIRTIKAIIVLKKIIKSQQIVLIEEFYTESEDSLKKVLDLNLINRNLITVDGLIDNDGKRYHVDIFPDSFLDYVFCYPFKDNESVETLQSLSKNRDYKII